jgi:hypothetical protein
VKLEVSLINIACSKAFRASPNLYYAAINGGSYRFVSELQQDRSSRANDAPRWVKLFGELVVLVVVFY